MLVTHVSQLDDALRLHVQWRYRLDLDNPRAQQEPWARSDAQLRCQPGVDLRGYVFAANYSLACVSFAGADLRGVSFVGKNCTSTDFSNANLEGCDFRGTELCYANFGSAKLKSTVLDPDAVIPEIRDHDLDIADLECRRIDGVEYVYGYRTKTSMRCGTTKYKPGSIHVPPWFSTSSTDLCHPGIYMAGLDELHSFYILEDKDIVCCRSKRKYLLKAGITAFKFRTRRLEILDNLTQTKE